MLSPTETRIAEDNRADRAAARREEANKPTWAELPSDAQIDERFQVHRKDSGCDFRTKEATKAKELIRNVAALRASPMLTTVEKALAIDTLTGKCIDGMLAECDKNEGFTNEFERIQAQGEDDAFQAKRPEWHGVAPELRAATRGMSSEELHAFVDGLRGTRHEALLRFAIASVPRELSGVSPTVYRELHDTTLALKDPTLLTRPADLKQRRVALEATRDGIRRTAAELSDPVSVAALRALVDGGNVS